MRDDVKELANSYFTIEAALKSIASSLLENLSYLFKEMDHIDKITTRVKNQKSFIDKASKISETELKYKKPFHEIQDLLGTRVVVFYKSDIELVSKIIEKAFNSVEKHNLIPEDENEFGYEGLHYVLFIPPNILGQYRTISNIPVFFELQIKTLYQHAWAQAEHGLGYKSDVQLVRDTRRKLAFVAAQSWGADEIFETLYQEIKKGNLNN